VSEEPSRPIVQKPARFLVVLAAIVAHPKALRWSSDRLTADFSAAAEHAAWRSPAPAEFLSAVKNSLIVRSKFALRYV
jgi:hypothetical protein